MSTLKLERISHVSLKKLETIKNVRKIREKKIKIVLLKVEFLEIYGRFLKQIKENLYQI